PGWRPGRGAPTPGRSAAARHPRPRGARRAPPVRYGAGAGAVDRIEPGTDEQLVEMTKRYLAPEKVEPYLEFARREQGDSVAVFLKPEHWLSSDLGSL
ncbi:pyridoxamine 5'-phosphate oxidase family protein, partial [Mycolicibacterium peregrinum]|uniref:pyridoxamine 5'-phosphate oxidase family protein n=1 Tax=Mycolicibacterium peregrinum TaxID=43304 RepID=UPI000AB33C67